MDKIPEHFPRVNILSNLVYNLLTQKCTKVIHSFSQNQHSNDNATEKSHFTKILLLLLNARMTSLSAKITTPGLCA